MKQKKGSKAVEYYLVLIAVVITVIAVGLTGCSDNSSPEYNAEYNYNNVSPESNKNVSLESSTSLKCDNTSPKYESIYKAIKTGDVADVNRHLCRGKSVNARSESGGTLLHYAVLVQQSEVVKFLIKKGAEVNAKDEEGYIPLDVAIDLGNLKIAKILVKNGANVNSRAIDNRTPLHWAARGGYIDIAKFLIKNGADINARDDYGATPIGIAKQSIFLDSKESAKMVELLRKHGGRE